MSDADENSGPTARLVLIDGVLVATGGGMIDDDVVRVLIDAERLREFE